MRLVHRNCCPILVSKLRQKRHLRFVKRVVLEPLDDFLVKLVLGDIEHISVEAVNGLHHVLALVIRLWHFPFFDLRPIALQVLWLQVKVHVGSATECVLLYKGHLQVFFDTHSLGEMPLRLAT